MLHVSYPIMSVLPRLLSVSVMCYYTYSLCPLILMQDIFRLQIYGEEFGIMGGSVRDSDGEKHQREDIKKDKMRGRKVSEQTSTQASPIRRKDSMGRRDR